MDKDILTILTGVRLFSDFNMDEIGWLSDKMTLKKAPDNSIIFNESELGCECYIILSGHVQVTKRDANKKEHEIARLGKGSCFGEMALVDTLPRSATVRTLDETSLAVLSQDALSRLKLDNMAVYSHVILNLSKEFSRRLRSMDEKYIKIMGFFF